MHKIESYFDPNLGLMVITVYGQVLPLDLVKCIDHYYDGQRCNLVLFDFSDANLASTQPELPEHVFKDKDRWSRKGDRKAFVFPPPSERNLKPFLDDYCRVQETGSNLSVFNSIIDANRWLMLAKDAHR